ncbi:MAG: DUF1232 domain-containing protein [Patescibacteria group bacterium]
MNSHPPVKPQFIQFFESLALPIKLLFDKEVPWLAKLLPITAFILYLILPFDFITDYIPVLGSIDDAAVLTGCAYLIVKLTPESVLKKYYQPPQTEEKIIDVSTKKPKK